MAFPVGAQPMLVPAVPTTDCSQGVCSLYCPQWCGATFLLPPPPPSFLFSDDPNSSSSSSLSPLIIVIIGILAAAFLLAAYYFILCRYCGGAGSLPSLFRRRPRPPAASAQALPLEEWRVSPSGGLEEALINKISAFKYRRGDGWSAAAATDCSVCLSEFRDEENLRRLPKCGHAFHMRCIDTWLRSHCNCPLCRANVVPGAPVPPPVLPGPEQGSSSPGWERARDREVVVIVDELDLVVEEGSHVTWNDADGIVEVRDDGVGPNAGGSFALESQRGAASIADVLRASAEEELQDMKEGGYAMGRSNALCCGISPAHGKR